MYVLRQVLSIPDEECRKYDKIHILPYVRHNFVKEAVLRPIISERYYMEIYETEFQAYRARNMEITNTHSLTPLGKVRLSLRLYSLNSFLLDHFVLRHSVPNFRTIQQTI
jgi:hypothetical protein